jgi:hypothetical protein
VSKITRQIPYYFSIAVYVCIKTSSFLTKPEVQIQILKTPSAPVPHTLGVQAMKTAFIRPAPRVNTSEIEPGGIGVQRSSRPQLSARWIIGNDGQLTCRWDIV